MSDGEVPGALTVALLVDDENALHGADGTFDVEHASMEDYVRRALIARGCQTRVIPFDPRITPTIDALRALQPDLVFNLTEWVAGERRHDAAIAGVLDMMAVRYTGAGPDAMRLARDKALAKTIVAGLGVDVAPHAIVNGVAPELAGMAFPMIVKPQFGDGSDGIVRNALVTTPKQLQSRIAAVRRQGDAALLCEQFVEGRDLFVALLGEPPEVMPPLELVVGRRDRGSPRFATSRVKNDAQDRRRWSIRYRRARLSAGLQEEIAETSCRIFKALSLRDYARIDYRLTREGKLVFLEANPNPDLTPNTFGRGVCFAGVSYDRLIGTIVDSALKRTH